MIRKGIVKLFVVGVVLIATMNLASAQERAIGARAGATGFEISYQHETVDEHFVVVDLGIDFGYNVNTKIGAKLTGVYNFIWARPAWTKKGSWAIYAGPGLSVGAVNDRIVIKDGDNRRDAFQSGMLVGIVGQVGLEYNFEIPLQLALEVRPVVGMHINKGVTFYDNGFLGLAPSLAVRYRF